jgi:hypothetical protein
MLADEVVWLQDQDAMQADDPLVIPGLWINEDAGAAKRMLRARSEARRATIVVPRFKGGDLAPLLGAPASVEVRPGDFDGIAWDDGQQYIVPGVSSLKTTLHAGRWAIASGVGTIVLCFRPHAAAGPIVVCTAALTSRPPGVELGEQRRLLARIVDEVASHTGPPVPDRGDEPLVEPAFDLDAYLDEEGEVGAVLLLAMRACKGDRSADVATVAREVIGVVLPISEVDRCVRRIPEASIQAIAIALRAHGWGAHLRQIERAMALKDHS